MSSILSSSKKVLLGLRRGERGQWLVRPQRFKASLRASCQVFSGVIFGTLKNLSRKARLHSAPAFGVDSRGPLCSAPSPLSGVPGPGFPSTRGQGRGTTFGLESEAILDAVTQEDELFRSCKKELLAPGTLPQAGREASDVPGRGGKSSPRPRRAHPDFRGGSAGTSARQSQVSPGRRPRVRNE